MAGGHVQITRGWHQHLSSPESPPSRTLPRSPGPSLLTCIPLPLPHILTLPLPWERVGKSGSVVGACFFSPFVPGTGVKVVNRAAMVIEVRRCAIRLLLQTPSSTITPFASIFPRLPLIVFQFDLTLYNQHRSTQLLQYFSSLMRIPFNVAPAHLYRIPVSARSFVNRLIVRHADVIGIGFRLLAFRYRAVPAPLCACSSNRSSSEFRWRPFGEMHYSWYLFTRTAVFVFHGSLLTQPTRRRVRASCAPPSFAPVTFGEMHYSWYLFTRITVFVSHGSLLTQPTRRRVRASRAPPSFCPAKYTDSCALRSYHGAAVLWERALGDLLGFAVGSWIQCGPSLIPHDVIRLSDSTLVDFAGSLNTVSTAINARSQPAGKEGVIPQFLYVDGDSIDQLFDCSGLRAFAFAKFVPRTWRVDDY
ncbi:hypothetical protein B0H12DRAFT_1231900 [Mycena haematopus]|nr:hypothetical protein B0H12DRAFT_1231900 [Mycena haematopus]